MEEIEKANGRVVMELGIDINRYNEREIGFNAGYEIQKLKVIKKKKNQEGGEREKKIIRSSGEESLGPRNAGLEEGEKEKTRLFKRDQPCLKLHEEPLSVWRTCFFLSFTSSLRGEVAAVCSS